MRRRSHGFTLIELLIVVAIVGILASIAIPLYLEAMRKAHRAAVAKEARILHSAMLNYNLDIGRFPSTVSPPAPAFDRTTLAPLSTSGYFPQPDSLTSKLASGRVWLYVAPTPEGDQFWALLRMKNEPNRWLLIAHTDRWPLDIGNWYDGVYFWTGTGWISVDELT